VWQLPSTTKGDILAVISDSIPVFDKLRYRFLNFAFSCMHCSSDLVSFLVTVRFGLQQACMKSSLERNARFCAISFCLLSSDVGMYRWKKNRFDKNFVSHLPVGFMDHA